MPLSSSLLVVLLATAVGDAPETPAAEIADAASEEASSPVDTVVRVLVGGIAPGSVQALDGAYSWAAVFAGIEVAAGVGMVVASIVFAGGGYLYATNILWANADELRASQAMLMGGGSLLVILPIVALANRGASAVHGVLGSTGSLLPE